MSTKVDRAATQTLEEVRRLRIKTHQADQQIQEAHKELQQVVADANRLGPEGRKFGLKLEEMLAQLEKLTSKPSLDADQFEQEHYSAAPEKAKAARLIVEGGDVPEPDAHALGLLLDLVENGSSEALDFENDIARGAFVWLMRKHEPAVEQIRRLAEIAGEVNSDHIKWAGKRVD